MSEMLTALYAEMKRAARCEQVWVMDLDHYKHMRRQMPAQPDGEEDEDKWVPSIKDRLLGLPILVRNDGGKPHIEWKTREEMAAHD